MIPKNLRAVATAFLFGTASVAAATALTTPVEAAVRASVGKPLQAAIAAANSGNSSAAMAHIKEAEAVGGLTAEEQKVLAQARDFIAAKSGGSAPVTSATSAQAKFNADYRARRYKDVIADADMLRKYNILNAKNMQVIAQAYYLQRDFAGCVRYAKSIGGATELLMRCAYEAHDDATYSAALEQLVASSGKVEYWQRLIKFAEGSKALSDHQSLDIYRIKFRTGVTATADDYFITAQYALQFGFASEAKSVIDAGIAKKVLGDARTQRLVKMANDAIASNQRNLPKTIKEANSAKNGDLLVKLGEDYCGMNKGKEAVDAVKAGIAKGVSDPDNAQIRLGQAYYAAGQKAQALAAFAKVSGNANAKLTAKLWTLYVKTH